ncbi:Transposable element Tcb2 transposase, partial [Araneus ventricosus]
APPLTASFEPRTSWSAGPHLTTRIAESVESSVNDDRVRFPSREQRPHEKKSAGPFDIGGKQQELHLDIANETGARERTSHRGPPQCR